MMKKLYLTIISLAFLLSSCNSWLDINPELEIRSKDMYTSQQGFMDVLTGAYIRMATPSLYGLNTTIKLPELMANHWKVSSPETLEGYVSNFDFTQTASKDLLTTVWMQYYQTIVNLNALLANIDGKESMFTDGNYNLIKGEALGLRAFLHFEILRYWGAAPQKINLDDKAIPYVTEVTKNPNLLLSQTYREVYGKIEADLDEAEKLLADDPIVRYKSTNLNIPEYKDHPEVFGAFPSSDFHYYRQIKFNYYAVLATKARYYLWRGNTQKARQYAEEVINAKNDDGTSKFTLGTENDANQGHLTFPTEDIFAVYNSNATNTLQSYFFDSQTMYTQDINSIKAAYETSIHASDIRFTKNRLWEEKQDPMQAYPSTYFKKFRESDTKAVNQMPVIRLSEMYFIAVECGNTDLFRTYRIARNLDASIDGTLVTHDDVMQRLEKEYRKEFYGEGQMFFFYKRLGYTNYTWPKAKTVDISNYKLPLPEQQASFE